MNLKFDRYSGVQLLLWGTKEQNLIATQPASSDLSLQSTSKRVRRSNLDQSPFFSFEQISTAHYFSCTLLCSSLKTSKAHLKKLLHSQRMDLRELNSAFDVPTSLFSNPQGVCQRSTMQTGRVKFPIVQVR